MAKKKQHEVTIKLPVIFPSWAAVDSNQWVDNKQHQAWTKEMRSAAVAALYRSGLSKTDVSLRDFVTRVQEHFGYSQPSVPDSPVESGATEAKADDVIAGDVVASEDQGDSVPPYIVGGEYPVQPGNLLAELLPKTFRLEDWYSVLPEWTKGPDGYESKEKNPDAQKAWEAYGHTMDFTAYLNEVRAQRTNYERAIKDWEFEHSEPVVNGNQSPISLPDICVAAGPTEVLEPAIATGGDVAQEQAEPATHLKIDAPVAIETLEDQESSPEPGGSYPVVPGGLFAQLLPAEMPADWRSAMPPWTTIDEVGQLEREENAAERQAAWSAWQTLRKGSQFPEFFRSVVSQRRRWESGMLDWESGNTGRQKVERPSQKNDGITSAKLAGHDLSQNNFHILLHKLVLTKLMSDTALLVPCIIDDIRTMSADELRSLLIAALEAEIDLIKKL